MKKRVLITGACGCVGRYLVRELLGDYHLRAVDKSVHDEIEGCEYIQADICDAEVLAETCLDGVDGVDGVCHLAAVVWHDRETALEDFTANVAGTFNLLLQCERLGIDKVVYASSEMALGFGAARKRLSPAYVPVDEDHPRRPQDWYSLSKCIGEDTCAMFSRRGRLRTICLRLSTVVDPDGFIYNDQPMDQAGLRRLARAPDRWSGDLWALVDARDVARAFRLALENETIEHDVFHIHNGVLGVYTPLGQTVREYYPDFTGDLSQLPDDHPFVSLARAREVLGFEPVHGWEDLVGERRP